MTGPDDPTVPSPIPPGGPPPSQFTPLTPPKKKRRSAVLFAVGCLGLVVLGLVGIVVLLALEGGNAKVSDNAVLKMSLSGAMPEYAHADGLEALFSTKVVTVHDHLMNLRKAAVDPRIKGVVLSLEPTAIGWAKVEELRDALLEFKKSGKFVIAYAEMLEEKEYALALAADEIVMPQDAPFEFNGLATDVSHYPGLLEKLGIEVQYFRYGKYKSVSGEQLGRKAFTEPVKEMITGNLARVFGHFVDAVSKYRKLERAQVEALIDNGHLKSTWAKEQKLIDKLEYWDELEDELHGKLGLKADEKIKWVSAAKYKKVSASSAGLKEGHDTLALIYSQGLIVAGAGDSPSPFGGDETQGSTPIIKALRRAVADKAVKAIVFRVDSPGGAGLGCDYVRREIEKAKAKKPVIVSMSDVAASGGYWVSMDATAIVAQPTTATGSVGIFAVVPNLGGLYDKLGLNNETFKQGAHADELIGARAMSEEEAKRFDDDLHDSYNRFVELAAKGRGKSFDAMQEVAQGRTWYGDKALELGLVDKLGGFATAEVLAKEKAGLAADAPVTVKLFDDRKTLLEQLFSDDDEESDGSSLAAALLKRAVETSGVGELVRRVPGFSAFAREVLKNRDHLFPLMEYRVDYH